MCLVKIALIRGRVNNAHDQYVLAIDSLVMFTMLSEVPILRSKEITGAPHGSPLLAKT